MFYPEVGAGSNTIMIQFAPQSAHESIMQCLAQEFTEFTVYGQSFQRDYIFSYSFSLFLTKWAEFESLSDDQWLRRNVIHQLLT